MWVTSFLEYLKISLTELSIESSLLSLAIMEFNFSPICSIWSRVSMIYITLHNITFGSHDHFKGLKN